MKMTSAKSRSAKLRDEAAGLSQSTSRATSVLERRQRFGSDFAHITIAPPVTLTPIARRKLLTAIRPGIDIDVNLSTVPPTQVTPAMPVQLGIDLIFERAAWFEPARN